jgi:AcrR family transcriptional regulator
MPTQVERSTATRERLLEAAVAALIERGHAGASLPEICRRAGVSRGAQLHHFPTRADLLAAAVEHLFTVRHRELREKLAEVPLGTADTLDRLWEIYTSGPLYAWLELVVAARVDPDLRDALAAVDRRFEDEAAETLARAFALPDGVSARAAARLVTSLLDGLATNRILRDDDAVPREVLALAAAILRPLLEQR